MQNFAIIEKQTNVVRDLVLWDGESPWEPDEGFLAIPSDSAQIGWNYLGGVFIAPKTNAPDPISQTKEQVENLRLTAYSNPITGCDRYFSEVMSLQAEGFAASSVEVKETKAKGLARKLEIQALYPYPEAE